MIPTDAASGRHGRHGRSGARVEAVTFDFWNTLAWEPRGHLRGRRLLAWSKTMRAAGTDFDLERLEAALDASWARYESNWVAGTQYLYPQAVADILEDLDLDLPEHLAAALQDAFAAAGRDADIRPAPGIAGCLRRLKAGGIRLGIVCDVGMTPSVVLREHLDDWGLLELFDGWTFSDDVGSYKPAAEIFERALAGLGSPEPSRTAHVGDRLRTDVAGALGMGMVAVRYTGLFDDTDGGFAEAHHVLARHEDIPSALAGGGDGS